MFNEHLLTLLGIAFILLELAAVSAALHAIMFARTSQAAIAWAISLVTFPYLSLPLYLIFGRRKFLGYVGARRSGDLRIQHIPKKLSREYDDEVHAHLAGEVASWSALEQLVTMPFTQGNKATLLIDGQATFAAIFSAIAEAKDYVLVQFFIVRSDALGNQLKDHLIAKAQEGVRVYFLYDQIGSHKLAPSYIAELAQAGVDIRAFRSSKGRVSRSQINFRNHRKIVVVDGYTAFVGGHNVGDEYVGRHRKLSPWRDTHVAVTGPSALCCQLAFVEDWHWITHDVPDLSWVPHISEHGNTPTLALPTGPADELDTCGLFFVHAIHSAKKRVWIVSPYFVPDEAVVSALQLAALRGVDVRIMLPDKPDHLLVYLAAFSYFRETIGVGIKLYRFEKGFLHQKVMIVDDDCAAIGTANLDNRSFRLNFEITLVFAETEFTQRVASMLDEDFQNSRLLDEDEYTKRGLAFRIGVKIARLMAPIL